jgi:hydroxyacylglutathione hydrolase
VTEVAPAVFVATAAMYTTTTTVVVGADGGCLVIDPAVTPADVSALASWLAARGLRPVAGWSTHPHWDHLLWGRELGADVPRYATPAAVAAVAPRRDELLYELAESAPGHDPALFARLVAMPGDSIPWAGPSAQVIAHAAHAPGHGAVYLPSSGVLVAGDMCSDIEIPLLDLSSADPFGSYRRGLSRLASVSGVRVVVPGHGHVGDAATFRSRVAADFAYLDALAAGVDAAAAGADVDDPRLADGADWLRADHARQLTAARDAKV